MKPKIKRNPGQNNTPRRKQNKSTKCTKIQVEQNQ